MIELTMEQALLVTGVILILFGLLSKIIGKGNFNAWNDFIYPLSTFFGICILVVWFIASFVRII